MPRYFMSTSSLAGMERTMMDPPNFLPRIGGRHSSPNFRYRPEDVDCKYCTEYRGRKKCTAEVCPYAQERLEAGAIGYPELVRTCFHGLPHQALALRIEHLPYQHFGFQNELHEQRLNGCGEMAQASQLTLATMYLLTAEEPLWAFAPLFVPDGKNDDLRRYALYQTAMGFGRGTITLLPDLLADPQKIDDETLWLIVNSSLIARYGRDVMKLNGRRTSV